MKLSALWSKSKALLDEYSSDGLLITDTELVDMKNRFILFADMAQKELIRFDDGYKRYDFTVVEDENYADDFKEVILPTDFWFPITFRALGDDFKDDYVYWEMNKKLFIDKNYSGKFRLTYKPIPTELTSLDSDIEVDDMSAQAIVYYATANIATSEAQNLVNLCWSKYEDLLAKINKPKPANWEKLGANFGDYYGY